MNNEMAKRVGSEISVIRQRYFLDHTSKSQTFITVEYTLIANNDEIDNIFIEVPRFLLNLKIYDLDGEELSLLPNDYTYALIEDRIEILNYQIRKEEERQLVEYYKELRDHKKYLLWIKLPPTKKLFRNEIRNITLQHDAERKERPSNKFELDFSINEPHNVFYAIRKPEDYEFSNTRIEITQGSDKPKRYKGENNNFAPIYVNKGFDSMVITKKSDMPIPIKVRYSFQPDKEIVSGPMTIAGWLSLLPLISIISKVCIGFCFNNIPPQVEFFIDHKIELGIGIITGALVLPALVNNQLIRNSLTPAIYLPIILAIIMWFI